MPAVREREKKWCWARADCTWSYKNWVRHTIRSGCNAVCVSGGWAGCRFRAAYFWGNSLPFITFTDPLIRECFSPLLSVVDPATRDNKCCACACTQSLESPGVAWKCLDCSAVWIILKDENWYLCCSYSACWQTSERIGITRVRGCWESREGQGATKYFFCFLKDILDDITTAVLGQSHGF